MNTNPREGIAVTTEAAIVVGVRLPGSRMDFHDPLGELRALAETAGARVVGELMQNRGAPAGRTFLGKGKTEELAVMVGELGARVVIFDNELSPSQIQELEQELKVKVIDRSELILDIFANRATTREAQLPVEIAQLEYTAPRLRAMWSHLGQVTGGAPVGVGTRGPGEQQLEIDRRIVSRRLVALRRELEDVQTRKAREVESRRSEHFTVGIVGYTNAGKSTLFNALVRARSYAADQLFATLDTTTRALWLGEAQAQVSLSDTVGFIRDLPHKLVEAFEATLQEAADADLLLHVVDAASPALDEQMAEVERVLAEIGAADVPQILVYNKCDLLEPSRQPRESADWLELHPGQRRARVFVSAVTGAGLPALRQAIAEHAVAARGAAPAGHADAAGFPEALSSPSDSPTITRTQPHA